MNQRPSKLPNALRKAAILISALEPRDADKLLDQMGEQQAARVRRAVMDLDDVTPEEQQRVIEDFLHGGRQPTLTAASGVELDPSLARRLAAGAAHDRPGGPPRPFQSLQDAEGGSLSKFLQNEHPQTGAIVLANLPARLAAQVLGQFPPQLQTDVLRRIAELGDTDPEILHELEQQIESLLSSQLRTVRRMTAGVATVEAILAAASGDGRDTILRNLTDHDQELTSLLESRLDPPLASPATLAPPTPAAHPDPTITRTTAHPEASNLPAASRAPRSRPSSHVSLAGNHSSESESSSSGTGVGSTPAPTARDRLPFEFRDIELLDDNSLAAVLRASEPRAVMLALTGANPQLVARLLKQLSSRDAKTLQQKLERVGPLRLADIERSQRMLADVAGRMVAEGAIRAPRPERLLAAA